MDVVAEPGKGAELCPVRQRRGAPAAENNAEVTEEPVSQHPWITDCVGTVPGNPAALVSKGSGLGASGRGSGGEVILILRALAGALRQRVKSAKEKRRSCLPPGLDELMREGLRLAWCGHDSGEEGVQMETLTCTIPRTESTCWGRGVAGEGLK